MNRYLVLLYGLGCYLFFLGVFGYAIGFVGGFVVPTTLDGQPSTPFLASLAIDLLLLGVFALQHSVMARPRFKQAIAAWLPQPIERSTYVLCTNLALGLLFWQWRPLGGIVWDLEQPLARTAAWGLFATGWLAVLVTTFLINHFDLFGLRQVWLRFRNRPYTPLPFVTPGPYRLVRHPLYVGWLLAFWSTPTMTVTHLGFALLMTIYILIAIGFEERDLIRHHQAYAAYRQQVPMLVPRWQRQPTVARQPVSETQGA